MQNFFEGKIQWWDQTTKNVPGDNGIYKTDYVLINSDPLSKLLLTYTTHLANYESIIAYVNSLMVENGLIDPVKPPSNLIFKGLAADFAELTTALYENNSIQKIDGGKLRKNEFQDTLRAFFNLESSKYNPNILSARFNQRTNGYKGFLVELQNALVKHQSDLSKKRKHP